MLSRMHLHIAEAMFPVNLTVHLRPDRKMLRRRPAHRMANPVPGNLHIRHPEAFNRAAVRRLSAFLWEKCGSVAHKKHRPVRRSLRTNGTPAEGALWRILKGRKVGGLRFRRQFSVGRHILDFYCPALRLAIELDGDYHYHCNVPEKDYERMSELEREYGIKTLRFENKVVFENPEGIVAEVMRAAEQCVTARAPCARTPPPLRGTSPKLGEESDGSGSPWGGGFGIIG